jgi:hypothetical protein
MDGADRLGTESDTIIAFLHRTVLAELRHAVRTGGETLLTAITLVMVDQYQTVLGPFEDGSGRAYAQAGRFRAMHTGKRQKSPFYVGKLTFPRFFGHAPAESGLDVTRTFTGRFTGTTSDTPALVINESPLHRQNLKPAGIIHSDSFITSTRVCFVMAVTTGSNAFSGSMVYSRLVLAPPSSKS